MKAPVKKHSGKKSWKEKPELTVRNAIRDTTKGKEIETVPEKTRTGRRTDALTISENQLRTLIETIPDLIWLKDKEGIYLLCNRMFENFFGASEADIAGKTDYDFVDVELADFFRENDRKAMSAGKPTSNE